MGALLRRRGSPIETPDVRTLNRWALSALPLFSILLYFILKGPFGAGSPDPEILRDPIQTPANPPARIEKYLNGRVYKMEPLYEYDIAGLVVSRWGGLFELGEVTFLNVGLVWGDNVRMGIYRRFKFTNDFFWLRFESKAGEPNDIALLRQDQLSNNHLLVLDEDIEKKVLRISRWDQIRVRGKLVKVDIYNAAGQLVGGKGTSTVRDDTGCETIYVESFETLKKGRPFWRGVHAIAFYGWLLLLAFNVYYAFKNPGAL